MIPHGAIQEVAFLDGRQIKLIDKLIKDPVTGSQNGYAPSQFDKAKQVSVFTQKTTNYDLPVEERQPLEIRATVVDLKKLRPTTGGGGTKPLGGTPPEYIIPNSGIIYATRDDALPDQTDPTGAINPDDAAARIKLSASDFKLDPTRRPNGIMLINGDRVDRVTKYRPEEKGLILASNLPVYVKGNFNLHKLVGTPDSLKINNVQEFKTNLDPKTWGNFYNTGARGVSNLNDNFACRKGDTRLPKNSCQTGDQWRSATVITDSITLLSEGFRVGFRNEGDYDLRNNRIDNIAQPHSLLKEADSATTIINKRLAQGFWNNNFVTNGLSSGSLTFTKDYFRPGVPSKELKTGVLQDSFYSSQTGPDNKKDAINSSYFNNFITPIQRRGNFPEYVMEVCPKLPVSECTAQDWVIGIKTGDTWGDKKADNTSGTVIGEKASAIVTGTTASSVPSNTDGLKPAEKTRVMTYQQYPRRIAFVRDNTGALILDGNNHPIPLGIADNNTPGLTDDTVQPFPYSTTTVPIDGTTNNYCKFGETNLAGCTNRSTKTTPRLDKNALWFATVAVSGGTPNPTDVTKRTFRPDFPLFYDKVVNPTNGKPVDASLSLLSQPLLHPVLQLQYTTVTPDDPSAKTTALTEQNMADEKTQWLARTSGDTFFNLVMATGDNPSRPPSAGVQADLNGGFANLPHFLENWKLLGQPKPEATNISGSFIQFKRSNYATAPWWSLPAKYQGTGVLFGYPQGYKIGGSAYPGTEKLGRLPYFTPPDRQWGFDVGLLSQSPDLFSQQFALSSTDKPNQYFREVSRDDEWVQTLLCAKTLPGKPGGNKNAINTKERPTGFCKTYAGS